MFASAFWYKSQAMALVVIKDLKQRLYLIQFYFSDFTFNSISELSSAFKTKLFVFIFKNNLE
jgi:hypothetical protein